MYVGLKRCGKSCRLRWMNYLSPTVKRGDFSEEENDLIIRLHNLLGNRPVCYNHYFILVHYHAFIFYAYDYSALLGQSFPKRLRSGYS